MSITYLDEEQKKAKITYLDEEPITPEIVEPKPKTFWGALGSEITPQMREQAPIPSAIAQTAQDVFATPAAFINQLLLNYPRAALKKAGIEYPEAGETIGGKIGATVGGALGIVTNPFLKALGLTKLGSLATKPIASGAIKGAIAGAAYAPTEDIVGIPQRTMQAAGGAVVGAAVPFIAKTLGGIGAKIREVPFAQKVRQGFYEAKQKAVEKFGSALDELSGLKPNEKVSLRSAINNLKGEIEGNPELGIPANAKLGSIVNRSPTLKKLLNKPEFADSVSLKDSQQIINELKSKISLTKLQGKSIIRPDDLPILDLVDDIKGSQLEAFPEMEQIRADYGQVMGKYNLIRSRIREGRLLKGLTTKFGDKEIWNAAKSLLKEKPELLREVEGFISVNSLLGIVGLLSKFAIGGAIAGKIGKTIFGGE